MRAVEEIAFGRVTHTTRQGILTPAYAKFILRGELNSRVSLSILLFLRVIQIRPKTDVR